jgi:hypothetical protein
MRLAPKFEKLEALVLGGAEKLAAITVRHGAPAISTTREFTAAGELRGDRMSGGNVYLWHLADMSIMPANVRFRG